MEFDIAMEGLDFEGPGYSAWPEAPNQAMEVSPDREAWLACHGAFLAASRKGDFSLVAGLAPMRRSVADVAWQGVAGHLIADFGPEALLTALLGEVSTLDPAADFEYTLNLCRILRGWGRLDVVPALLGVWERLSKTGDAMILPVWISQLLEQHSGPLGDAMKFASVDAYRTAVQSRYQNRLDKFGSAEVFVLLGARFGVERLASRIIQQVREASFPDFLRHSFEASTGMDCTDFFDRGLVQTFVVKRKMEEFLDSPATERFEDGKRYFFGHRIG